MKKGYLNYRDYINAHDCISCEYKQADPPLCPLTPCACCCAGPPGPQGEPGPFLSSYIEAVGRAQTVANGSSIIFDTDEDRLDIAGGDIEIDSTGTIFTITRAGLYHIEWSVNLGSGSQPVLLGLMENGVPSSALSNAASNGNYSSGALINVSESDVPCTVSLYNFGAQITLEHPVPFENTAASMRILRFADGPSR